MVKISNELFELLRKEIGDDKLGYFDSDFGAIIGEAEFVVYKNNDQLYLCHISEFEQSGYLIRLKEIN